MRERGRERDIIRESDILEKDRKTVVLVMNRAATQQHSVYIHSVFSIILLLIPCNIQW